MKYDKVTRLLSNGASREVMCEKMGITMREYITNMENDSEFREAVNLGDHMFTETLEQTLYKTAQGHMHTESEYVEEVDSRGEVSSKTVTREKYYKPDVTALKYALSNRDPENWKDKQDINLDAATTVNIINDLNNG